MLYVCMQIVCELRAEGRVHTWFSASISLALASSAFKSSVVAATCCLSADRFANPQRISYTRGSSCKGRHDTPCDCHAELMEHLAFSGYAEGLV